MNKTLILITGHPASGKTTLSTFLKKELKIPCVERDDLKEFFYNQGFEKIDAQPFVGQLSFYLISGLLKSFSSFGHGALMVVTNINNPEDFKFLENMDFTTIEIHCVAKEDELIERYISRANSSNRGEHHQDKNRIDEFKQRLRIKSQPLGYCRYSFEFYTSELFDENPMRLKIVEDIKKMILE